MTKDYALLYEKAQLLADLFGYELICCNGIFDFYNSPDFRNFRFEVDPETFRSTSVEWFLYKKFEGRICADGQI